MDGGRGYRREERWVHRTTLVMVSATGLLENKQTSRQAVARATSHMIAINHFIFISLNGQDKRYFIKESRQFYYYNSTLVNDALREQERGSCRPEAN